MLRKIISVQNLEMLQRHPYAGTLRTSDGRNFDDLLQMLSTNYLGKTSTLDPRNPNNYAIRDVAELRFTRQYAKYTDTNLEGVLKILIRVETIESMKWLLDKPSVLQTFIDHLASDVVKFEHFIVGGERYLIHLLQFDKTLRELGKKSPITKKNIIDAVRYKCLIREIAFRLTEVK